jgi:hypothetical protein
MPSKLINYIWLLIQSVIRSVSTLINLYLVKITILLNTNYQSNIYQKAKKKKKKLI